MARKQKQNAQDAPQKPEVSQPADEPQVEEIVAPPPAEAQGDGSDEQAQPEVSAGEPKLTAEERGAPGKHIIAIIERFGCIPKELILNSAGEAIILIDGSKWTADKLNQAQREE